jgi:dihydrofolate reductase
MGAEAVIVAGGATIYAETLPFADAMILTELDLEAEGDASFPAVDPAQWQEVSRVHHPRGEGDDAAYDVVRLERR